MVRSGAKVRFIRDGTYWPVAPVTAISLGMMEVGGEVRKTGCFIDERVPEGVRVGARVKSWL